MEFTKEEITNLTALIDAGARAVCAQKSIKECAAIMSVADALIDKLNKKEEE